MPETASFELPHDKTNKMTCAPSEDSDQLDAQADLSLCWVHMPFCWLCHNKEFSNKKIYYRNDPKFSDRYAWANRADTVCHSVCIV